jgi:hypothetical protein
VNPLYSYVRVMACSLYLPCLQARVPDMVIRCAQIQENPLAVMLRQRDPIEIKISIVQWTEPEKRIIVTFL